MSKNHPEFNKDDILEFMKIIYSAVKEIKTINNLVLLGRNNFINNIKSQTSSKLLKAGMYAKLTLPKIFDSILSNLFVNLQLY